MPFIHIHVYAIGLPIVCVTDNHCESSNVSLSSDSRIPEEIAMMQEVMASMCIKVTGLVLILSVSAMCPCVMVNQCAICTVTLTWVNCEANSRQRVAL